MYQYFGYTIQYRIGLFCQTIFSNDIFCFKLSLFVVLKFYKSRKKSTTQHIYFFFKNKIAKYRLDYLVICFNDFYYSESFYFVPTSVFCLPDK